MQANHNLSFQKILHHLYTEGGVKRFWKGSSVIATGCVPAHALYFSVYEYIKKHTGVDNHGFQFIASAITGCCSTFVHDFIITPYDGKFFFFYQKILSNKTKNAAFRTKQMSSMRKTNSKK